MAELTQTYLKEILNYDPETGIFTWRVRKAYCIQIGDVAGALDDGYIRIEIDGKSYRAQRLAWLYMTGEWPKGEADHRNTKRSNNTWENLRDATHAQNQHNAGLRTNNTSGFKGVHKVRGKFRAMILKNKHLGYFYTAEEAAIAYDIAARNLFGEFARTNFEVHP